MRRLLRSNIALLTAAALFASYFAIGALAAPGATPWPDPLESNHQAVFHQGEDMDATPTEDVEATSDPTEDAETTPEPTAGPDDAEGDHGLDAEATEQPAEATPGVPLDSPACVGDEQHPNPHDTDGDFDGCRVVQTDDGPKNLPDPAADAQEGNPGNIGNHGEGNKRDPR